MSSSAEKTKARYQGEQGRQYHFAKRSVPEEAVAWIARHRAEKLAAWVKETDAVFEYGAGPGWNLAALPCARRAGCDVADFLEPFARSRGIEFFPAAGAADAGGFDAVICHHTLEHVPSPPEALAEMRRLLRPGGRLLLFVPYEKERKFRSYRRDEPNHHLYSWNAQTLGALAEENGFEVIHAGLGDFGQERFSARWAARLKLGEPGFRLLRFVANRLKHELEVRVIARKAA